MRACMHVRMCACVCTCMCTCMCISMCMGMCTCMCMCMCMYVCMYLYIYIHMSCMKLHRYISMWVCIVLFCIAWECTRNNCIYICSKHLQIISYLMYLHTHLCMNICVYMCIYIYIYTHEGLGSSNAPARCIAEAPVPMR